MTDKINERELALGILLEVEKGEKSHIILRQVLEKYQYLSKQERAFITRLTEGTIERQIELDYIINCFSKVKTVKMKPVIRNILRMSVYQMKYMDQVPDRAACNEAVNLAVRKGFKTLRGFVNGVLRNISREIETVEYPKDPVEALSVKWSIPQWIIQMWIRQYGQKQTEEVLKNIYVNRDTAVRVNEQQVTKQELMDKLNKENVSVKEHPDSQSVLLLSGYDHLGALDSFCAGDFQVQDAASVLVAENAGIQEGDYVIDVCAAPGGKALHAAQILKGTGHVEARDLTEYKVNLIRDNIERMNFDNIEAVQQDALEADPDSYEKADVVIADLPCSGLGVLSKKTDLKYKISEEGMIRLEELQRQILDVVCRYVKPGGTLLYSTCTINKGENDENVRWFVENHSEFEEEWGKQIFPSEFTDGFYIARFHRKRG